MPYRRYAGRKERCRIDRFFYSVVSVLCILLFSGRYKNTDVMKFMRLAAALAVVMFSPVWVCAQEMIYRPDDFSRVDVSNKIKARLVPGKENKVEITGDDVHNVVVKNVKGRLTLRLKTTKSLGSKEYGAVVYYAKMPSYFDASQGGEIVCDSLIRGSKVEIDAGTGGFVLVTAVADTVRASIAAGGQIQLRGDGRQLSVGIKTGGQFSGYDFDADNAQVNITAGGTADVNASEKIIARVSMGGTVRYKGTAKLDGKTTMGGSIIQTED